MHKITYLIANYNCGDYIQECIDSLKSQTSDRWLCLICDDASTDGSIQVIEENLSQQIRIIRNKTNRGYIETLKRLINESDTEVVGILDSDDALYTNATQEVLAIYDRNNKYGFVYTNFQTFDPLIRKKIDFCECEKKPNDKTALVYGFVGHLKTFRKSDYFKTPMFDNEILYAEDRDLVYMMEEVTDFYFINKKLYKYRKRANSQSSGEKFKIGIQSHVKARKKALIRRNVKGLDLRIHNFFNFLWTKQKIFLRILYLCQRMVRLTNHSSGRLRRR